MTVLEVMTQAPACATADTPLEEIARMMVDENCGCIPIVDEETAVPIGVITDRDIVCRSVALSRDPLEMFARDAMTHDCVTIRPDAEVELCAEVLERNQIRRVVVVDASNRVIGIVSQADLARRSARLGGEIVAAVSVTSLRPSAVH